MANSPKYHPITEKLWKLSDSGNTKDQDDAIVRSHLEACAEKLVRESHNYISLDMARNCLGLGDVEAFKVGPTVCPHGKRVDQKCGWCPKKAMEAPKQEFAACPKCYWGMEDNWKFCPLDGTPRPKPLSLSERLIEHLNAKHQCSISEIVAESAIQFLKENK